MRTWRPSFTLPLIKTSKHATHRLMVFSSTVLLDPTRLSSILGCALRFPSSSPDSDNSFRFNDPTSLAPFVITSSATSTSMSIICNSSMSSGTKSSLDLVYGSTASSPCSSSAGTSEAGSISDSSNSELVYTYPTRFTRDCEISCRRHERGGNTSKKITNLGKLLGYI